MVPQTNQSGRWSVEQALAWYEAQPWLCGCNYLPSNAVNSTEMWQAETFAPDVIERELGWAASLGMNSCRVFIQYLVWEADPQGFKARFAQFLDICGQRSISVMPVLFDDCHFAGKEPYLGPQDAPIPGVHNSGWTPSPGHLRVTDDAVWPQLMQYISDMIGSFAQNPRIVAWDLYNEPGVGMGNKSLPLLEATFAWARDAQPSQPLTVCLWNPKPEYADLHRVAAENSDVISFHDYNPMPLTGERIAELRSYGRPLVCTEWMARVTGSRFETHLPVFQREQVGCYCWGLVTGKTQTRFVWGSKPGASEPDLWLHDVLYPDGKPYCQEEAELIRAIT
jgi:hypothetical protein